MTKQSFTCWSSNTITISVTFRSEIPRNSTFSPMWRSLFSAPIVSSPVAYVGTFYKGVWTWNNVPTVLILLTPTINTHGVTCIRKVDIGTDQWKLKGKHRNYKLVHFSMLQEWFIWQECTCHCIKFQWHLWKNGTYSVTGSVHLPYIFSQPYF